MKEGKSDQTTRCVQSRKMNRVIDYVLSIGTFEQQCVVLKVMVQSTRLKDHVHTIGIEPFLINNILYMNINVLKTSKHYTNKLVSMTTSNSSKILLKLLWFLLQKDLPTAVLYPP